MKKLIYLTLACLAIVSCKQEPKNYVTFSGKITNKNSDSIVVSNRQFGFKRVIKVDENGAFKDTLNVKNGIYTIYDGKEGTSVFLRNGDEINMTIDTKEFDETVTYTGKGSDESNFLAQSALAQESFFSDEGIFDLSKEDFDAKINSYVDNFKKRIGEKQLDSVFTKNQHGDIEGLKQYLYENYEVKAYIAKNLAKGLDSPKFEGYENHKGGTTSLDDLKGKYVYIDVWATWCQPCKNEIPYLKKVEEQFHDKNIEFVSISVDQPKDYETWKKMVTEKELGGVQLIADNNWSSKFVQDYKINGIPRFILIDTEGKIISPDAPRPSDSKLTELLTSLNL